MCTGSIAGGQGQLYGWVGAATGCNEARQVMLMHAFACSLMRAFARSLMRAFARSLVHAFERSIVCAFLRSLVYAFARSLVFAFVRSLISACICSLSHACIYTLESSSHLSFRSWGIKFTNVWMFVIYKWSWVTNVCDSRTIERSWTVLWVKPLFNSILVDFTAFNILHFHLSNGHAIN